MAAAFGWGTLAGSSPVIGALIALWFRISLRVIGLIMGFGAGVLISALAFDLVQEAVEQGSGHGRAAVGLFAGCLVFFGGDWLIDRAGGSDRKDATGSQKSGSSLAIVLGTVLDGIPESMVIGLTILQGGAVGAAYLAAVFISNLPEAISSTAGLVTGGWKKARILWMWIAIAVVSGLASLAGYSPVPRCLTGHRRLRPVVRGGGDPDHARGHHDARGVRARRQAGRGRDHARVRGRVHHPYPGLSIDATSRLAPSATRAGCNQSRRAWRRSLRRR
jgi:zinc transporter, ZIP family